MHGLVSMTISYYPLIMMTILTLFDINANTIAPCPTEEKKMNPENKQEDS
jgi:hypothetical protein